MILKVHYKYQRDGNDQHFHTDIQIKQYQHDPFVEYQEYTFNE